MDKRFRKLETDIAAIAREHDLLNLPCRFASCREIYLNNSTDYRSRGNAAYMLQTDSGKILVYCQMTGHGIGACGGGGWTLVMKTNGRKQTFRYDSSYWTNKVDFNSPGGMTGFDHNETKLPTYWSTPFSRICLGMKIGNQIKFIVVNRRANSLYSLIADGNKRSTSLGRNTWKSLIGHSASLQRACNREGFNVKCDRASGNPKARIGFLANNEYDCKTCDSWIGFGTEWCSKWCNGNPNTCGNDNGKTRIRAMGYILVQ